MTMDFLSRLAVALAKQFGDNCEVVVHDLTKPENTIVAIENGHVSNRKLGDGPSHIVLEAMKKKQGALNDQLGYLARTHDGRIVKSSTVYIRDEQGSVEGIFSINYDITGLLMAESAVKSIINHDDGEKPERIPQNVNDLLDDLIDQSVATVGKPVALMSKDDKIRAIQYLNNAGAFLITKSGDKVSKHFGISKYTLYSYIDAKD
ncbi:MAG TPA: helix-turn-helix transcriptional regulator [Clostridia bacterium]|nr:MAG: YheO-like PAS domain protein [Firmicutes bacterium ADurb.Bin356]HOF93948.1 helix-turn-helix transcriptional regulator [Clostridia bacterium]HPY36228.1 helix-turn-helix transcriptional regulator [Clostridia bacterium]